MTTQIKQEPGLLHSSQGRAIKPSRMNKVTTTVRLDQELKKQAEVFARSNHMDFTTFLSFALRNTMQYGGKIEPRMPDEKYTYYQKMADDVDAGRVSTEHFSTIADMRHSYSL